MIGLDWPREPWRKLYTRNSGAFACLSWDAQALLMQMLRACDRSGRLLLGSRGLAALPVLMGHCDQSERIMVAANELIDNGCVSIIGAALLLNDFEHSQYGRTADSERAQRSRDVSSATFSSQQTSTDVVALTISSQQPSELYDCSHSEAKDVRNSTFSSQQNLPLLGISKALDKTEEKKSKQKHCLTHQTTNAPKTEPTTTGGPAQLQDIAGFPLHLLQELRSLCASALGITQQQIKVLDAQGLLFAQPNHALIMAQLVECREFGATDAQILAVGRYVASGKLQWCKGNKIKYLCANFRDILSNVCTETVTIKEYEYD